MKKTSYFFIISICILLLITCLMASGCGRVQDEALPLTSVEEMRNDGMRIGVQTGTSYDTLSRAEFPDAKLLYYNSITDMAYCVSAGEIDAFAVSETVALTLENEIEGITHLPEHLEELDVCFVYPKNEKGRTLQSRMNEFLAELRADGTLDRITEAWITGDADNQVTDASSLSGENGTVHLAVESAFNPYCFIRNGEVVGIDMDLIIRFCTEYGYSLEISDMNYDAIIPSLGTRCDMGTSGITYSEERAKQVLFSDPYSAENTVMMVRKASENGERSYFKSLRDSFFRTFILEERWKLIARGIETTLLISVMAALAGTVLGFGLCLLRITKNRFCFGLTSAYIRILQGTPLVVLLMILYYIVFAGTSLSGAAVAIIAFALNFAAYVSEMMRTGIEAVDRGQMEAALAIGYTRPRAFFRIIFPQAAEHFLPVYKGELISLVKSTSVVGYVAVQDLTKMSDIIRSRTYEAFFPLIATAVIYFLIAAGLTAVLKAAENRIKPNRKNRTVKGVKLS